MVRTLRELMASHGIEAIGAAQRTIAYTAVASGGTGLLNFTAAGHGLKKHQSIYVSTGAAYTGSYRVKKIIDANTFQVEGTFGATTSGNITLTAALFGFGFIVDSAPTIAEFVPEDSTVDPAEIIAKTFVVGQEIYLPFKKLRITAGNLTVVRQPPRTTLPYSNR